MPKVTKQRQKRTSIILLSSLAAIFVAGVLYFLFTGGPAPDQAITGGAPGWEQPSESAEPRPPEKQPTPPSMESEQAEPPPPPADTPPPAAPTAEASCRETHARVADFFSYLDQRTYLAVYELEGGSERHFSKLIEKLFANSPVVVRETDSLFTILQNTAHFYRVMGRDNVFLAKDILEGEAAILEPTLADFYRLSLETPDCTGEKQAITLPLENLYEYAGFFLNTLGGQSYLFRRAPRIRTLTKYYSVLVIDRADEQGLNKYGIDLRPTLDGLTEEMEAMPNLTSREEYLRTLQNLKIKYQARRGG
jgi:hypothetical protein